MEWHKVDDINECALLNTKSPQYSSEEDKNVLHVLGEEYSSFECSGIFFMCLRSSLVISICEEEEKKWENKGKKTEWKKNGKMLREKESRIGYSVGMLKSTTKVGRVVKIVEYVGRSNYIKNMHRNIVENNSGIKQNKIIFVNYLRSYQL